MEFNSVSTPARRRFSTRFIAAQKLVGQSGFFSPRFLTALLLCLGACFFAVGTLLAFTQGDGSTKFSRRTLTFTERVAYQYAIEDVYWRHRIWPRYGGEQPDPKPSLDAVMSQAQIEKKVSDYLRKSQALGDYWQRPITAEQLQAEMDRMAKHSKQPEVLSALFAALGNDPFVIAECLARPALAERLLTSWYAYDQRLHGELKQRAESELLTHSMAEVIQARGTYSEIDLIKADGTEEQLASGPDYGMKLTDLDWDETVAKLAATLGGPRRAANTYEALPKAKLSPLQEGENRYYALGVLLKTANHIKLAGVSWLKEPLESWLDRAEKQIPAVVASPAANYTLPVVSNDSACIDDTWTATSVSNAPPGRGSHTTIWTGSEMIVWGGRNSVEILGTGGRYNPSTDTWTRIATANAPTARAYHTAVWTGTKMIIWGGFGNSGFVNTGAKYNPASDTWADNSTTNAPTGRVYHTAVWTGSEMIVWGGRDSNNEFLNSGGKYNPSTDSWVPSSRTNAPVARYLHTAIWSGSEMIVWGGTGNSAALKTGGRYKPATNSWTPTSTINAPPGRQQHTAVWTGDEMIIWGGYGGTNTGGRYAPTADSWTTTSTVDAAEARSSHTAVWSGSEMIVWGGDDNDGLPLRNGGRYKPNTNSWTSTSTTNAPGRRANHTAVWTGSEMIVWGGANGPTNFNAGGRYCAQSGSPPGPTPTPTATVTATPTPTASPTPTPTPTPCTGRCAPTPRARSTAVPRPTPP